MVVLIERGAPRDFRDIYTLCQAGMTTPIQCGQCWHKRQELTNNDIDSHRARSAVETHLARISQHHPMAKITDPAQREAAKQVRTWFREVFIYALMD